MSTAVRISRASHDKLRRLADADGISLVETLDRAIEAYRRDIMLRDVDQAYSALKLDAAVWSEELSEREEMEGTIGDGLQDDE